MFFSFCFLYAFLDVVNLVLEIRDFFHCDVVNRVLLLHFLEDFLEFNYIRVGLNVHVRGLHLLILFHQICVFGPYNLPQNPVRIQDV